MIIVLIFVCSEFDLLGYDPAIVNALRRILLSDIPSMAIEKIHMYQVNDNWQLLSSLTRMFAEHEYNARRGPVPQTWSAPSHG